MVKTKKNQEKVVVTRICFYSSAKKNEKLKCVMENKGSVANIIKVRGNSSMLISKPHALLNISAPC